MTWEDVMKLTPTQIARALGCPVTTASSWKHKGPPEWQRVHYLKAFTAKKKIEPVKPSR